MTTQAGKTQGGGAPQDDDTTRTPPRDPKTGIDREVGDLDDPDAPDNDDALPGRAGGGLAGG
ncbi:hypothetical protein BEN78_00045 [Xanthomonas citri pv. mangiferaeindicae]|nr:hypothetical protein BEN78_00045 [Xanthomonas citri pv. mangiferaeindicae]